MVETLTNARAARLLIVEDESVVALDLQHRLADLGYEVPAVAASGEAALRKARELNPDLVLMDIRIQGEFDGIETARRLQSTHSVPVVYLTSYSDDMTLERARATRPFGFLVKPFSERELHATIQMALERWKLEKKVHESEARLRLALDAAGMDVWELDPVGRRAALGDNSAALLGMQAGGVYPLEEMLRHIDDADREALRAALEQSLEKLARYRIEFRPAGREKQARWLSVEGEPYSPKGGGAPKLIGVIQDITERKRVEEKLRDLNENLERLVAERTVALQTSLSELDAFSYSVAHDLRAPLRAVAGFSAIMLEDAALDANARNYVERVRDSGLRMGRLVDSLLELTRLSRATLQRRHVKLSALAKEIADELASSEPRRKVTWDITPNLSADVDPGLIEIVLNNLLSNAWKFTSKRPEARVEFGETTENGERVFFVRDNGAGFDMAFANKLFGTFQRLHSNSEFEGIGIGLATVQRIIQRHGGRIWGRGIVDGGATFFFTLP